MLLTGVPDIIRKRIEVLLEVEDNLILFIDSTGTIKDVNKKGVILLDSNREILIGQHIIEIISDDHRNLFSVQFHKMIESKKTISFEVGIKSSMERELFLSAEIVPIIEDNNISEIIFTGKDITRERMLLEKIKELNVRLIEAERLISIERQRANRKKSILDELNKLKSDFISNISHEFRTPLASIIGFSETIISDPEMTEENKIEFNNVILNEGKRLAKLINDILDISKIEGGKLELQKTQFDLTALMKELLVQKTVKAESIGISIITEFPDEEVMITADKERIAQVFTRLLNNAIKFNTKGGRIRVIIKTLFREIEVIISDTGIGIPEKDIPFLFQKFYRVSRPGTEIPGTGLGLVFVKQIVDLHKGFITVQSESGKGTTFAIKLPKNKNYQ